MTSSIIKSGGGHAATCHLAVDALISNSTSELDSFISRGVVASAPDFERADEGSILTAGLCFKSGKSECNNSGYKLTGLTWWP